MIADTMMTLAGLTTLGAGAGTITSTINGAVEKQSDGTYAGSSKKTAKGFTTVTSITSSTTSSYLFQTHREYKALNAQAYVDQLSDDELQELCAKLDGVELDNTDTTTKTI